MKRSLLFSIVFSVFILCSCEEGSMRYITTDHNGYAEEFLNIPGDGKIRIVDIDATCGEVERAGKFYRTHYLFMLRDLKVIMDCDCNNFKMTEFFNVQKNDQIKMMIKYGEATTKYKIKYEFIGNK